MGGAGRRLRQSSIDCASEISSGQRLAKRNRAITLRHLRDCRHTPDDVWRMIGLTAEAGAEVC